MSPALKIFLYVVLLACGIACAYGVKVNLSGVGAVPDDNEVVPTAARTNLPAAITNAMPLTNQAPATNAVVSTDPVPAATTNSVGPTNAVVGDAANPGGGAGSPSVPQAKTGRSAGRVGRAMAFGGVAFLCLVGLGLLIGHDVSRFLASRFESFVFNADLLGTTDPEYEQAEEVWKAGRYLEAVQLMRDYYKRHPREVYVALRIAEIYETDLRNHLASALEYEEVLKKRLPPERWGWAAIHLANLYSGKLNKPAEATRLLRRIVEEFRQTAAAKKARQRLGIPEPEEEIETPPPEEKAPAEPEPQRRIKVRLVGEPVRPAVPEEAEAERPPEPVKPSLPPGFRPKK
jgi:TolA-binding protein